MSDPKKYEFEDPIDAELLSEWQSNGSIELGRGDIISKDDIEADPGPNPIYSSSAHNNGKFGEYAKYMFNEELITWSVDGGGNLFYRPKHKFSVTNVCGYMRIKSDSLFAPFVFYSLFDQHRFLTFDYTTKAHPSVIRKLYRIPKIDYPTQSKIARILQTIDRAIEQTEALIEKYQQIKAGLMHDLFTRGLWTQEELDRGDHKGTPVEATAKVGQLRPHREQAPQLYQETAIGWVPKAWQYEILDSLAIRGSGHTPSKSFPEYWGGGIKWISLADSHRLDKLYIDETDYDISELGIQNSSAVLHPPGIVVLSRDAGVGKSAITRDQMAVSQHFMCWRCEDKMDNHFLYYWMQHNKRFFENIAMGSTILTIGLSYFRRLKIACPRTQDEQQAIASRLNSTDSKIFTLQKELSKSRELKSGLMHDLLTGKKPVTPDPEN